MLLAPLPPPVGGVANWTKILFRHLGSDNKNFMLLDTAVRWRNITKNNILLRLFGGTLQALLVLYKTLILLSFDRPSVIHICTSGGFSFVKDLIIIYISNLFGTKVLLHIRIGRLPDLLISKNWEYKLFYLAFSAVDNCLVIDKRSFNALLERFDNIEKIKLLSNFIDLKEVNLIEDTLIKNEIDLNLIFIGHVIPAKGIIELFEAIKILDDPRIKLHVVGPYEKKMKKELDLIGINNVVEYYGMVKKKRVLELINISSALILPSYTEGFPNVVLEAMACEKAVLATNVGAIPEILNLYGSNKCGMCFEAKSVIDIVSCIQLVLNENEYLKIWGRNGRKRVVEVYSTSIVIPQLKRLWNEM